MNKPVIVAEIGCNHKGRLDVALKMIDIASEFCDVDVVKFQKRNPFELLSDVQYDAPHPTPHHSYGVTYGEHRENLELSIDDHRTLKEYCEGKGVVYSTSVWDLTSAKEIAMLSPLFLKVPSACNLDHDLLSFLCDNYGGEIHLSLGMTTQVEEELILNYFTTKGRVQDLVLYACTSGYPIEVDEICLNEITRIKESYGSIVKSIGFSGHHLGISADVAAYTLGAEWIERHFTLDRTWKGTDHAASLEPDGMRRLGRNLKALSKAFQCKPESGLLDCEIQSRAKLKSSNSLLSFSTDK